MSENRNACRILVRKPESKNNFDDVCVDDNSINMDLKHDERARIRLIGISIRVGTSTTLF
jgi:hypothetical protein